MRNNLNLAEKGTEVLYAYFLLLAWKTEGFFDFQIHKYKYKCCMRTLLVLGDRRILSTSKYTNTNTSVVCVLSWSLGDRRILSTS